MLLNPEHPLPKHPTRIISTVPSQTELLFDLGLDSEVIGITRFCIHPKHWYQNKKRIGGTKDLHLEKIFELNPDLIIANKEENKKEQIETLAHHFPVWLTDVSNFSDALRMISDLGELANKKETAQQFITQIIENWSLINTSEFPLRNVIYLIWKDPYMTIGGDTFINDLLLKAGLKNIFASRNRYPILSEKDIQSAAADLILLSSEPFPFSEKHIATLKQIAPEKQIILVDGEMFSWYGSRLALSAPYIKELQKAIW